MGTALLLATSAAAERNWSAWGRQFSANRASIAEPNGMKAISMCSSQQRADMIKWTVT
jgi:hypothetical protein